MGKVDIYLQENGFNFYTNGGGRTASKLKMEKSVPGAVTMLG